MHQEALERFKAQIDSGYTLMYHPTRACYDLAIGERQIEQKKTAGFVLVHVAETPPEAQAPEMEAEQEAPKAEPEKPAAKGRGRRKKSTAA